MLTHTQDKNEYMQAKAIRNAVAQAVARRVIVTEEMIAVKEKFDAAQTEYRLMVEVVAKELQM